MQKKRRIFLILAALIATTVICFWDSILVVAAPKSVLAAAINDAVEKLEERSQGSPLWILGKGYDDTGKNTTQLLLKTTDGTSREVIYDMQIQTDLTDNQLYAEGTVITGENTLDLSVYLDETAAAVTSDDLLPDGFLGITYDTFADDVRSLPLINFLIPGEMIEDWETAVVNLRERMNFNCQLPKIPNITQDDIRLLYLAIFAMKSEVTREEVLLYSQPLDCYKLTYTVQGEQIAELLPYLMNGNRVDDCEISVSFYLYKKNLVKVQLRETAGESGVNYVLTLGTDAARDDLLLTITDHGNDREGITSVVVKTKRTTTNYAETICVNDTVISYDWNNATGDLRLTLQGDKTILLNLAESENGFCVKTMDMAALIGVDSRKTCDCTMTICKGAEITKPMYKNINAWSMDDLTVLLRGLGILIGYHTE